MTFTVYGTPQPKGSARAFVVKGHAVVTTANKSLKSWESSVRAAAQTVATGTLMLEAVILHVEFYMDRPKSVKRPHPVTRPDLSKLIRGIEDALTDVIWKDDSQVVSIHAWKHYALRGCTPKVVISIEPYPEIDSDRRPARRELVGEF